MTNYGKSFQSIDDGLVITVIDVPDLSQVAIMISMFF